MDTTIENGECQDLDKEWVEERLGFQIESVTDLFFTTDDYELDNRYLYPIHRRKMTALALQLCERCPVQKACLDLAMSFTPAKDFGIFAGTTPSQRRSIRRRRRRLAG